MVPPRPAGVFAFFALWARYSAGTGCASAKGAGLSRRKQRFTKTKNSGTKKIARKVAVKVPPTTARPMAFWPPAPAPVAIARGSTPKTKAKLVIRIGRSRSLAASIAESNACRADAHPVLGEFDDQDRILAGKADRRDQADLEIDVVVEAGQLGAEQRADDAERHDEHHRERDRPALVERGEAQEDDQQRQAVEDRGLPA